MEARLAVWARYVHEGLVEGNSTPCLGYQVCFSINKSDSWSVAANIICKGKAPDSLLNHVSTEDSAGERLQIPDAQPPDEPYTATPSYWHALVPQRPLRSPALRTIQTEPCGGYSGPVEWCRGPPLRRILKLHISLLNGWMYECIMTYVLPSPAWYCIHLISIYKRGDGMGCMYLIGIILSCSKGGNSPILLSLGPVEYILVSFRV